MRRHDRRVPPDEVWSNGSAFESVATRTRGFRLVRNVPAATPLGVARTVCPEGSLGTLPSRKAHLGTRAGVVSKAFVVAAVVALVGALTASPPDTERPDPRWYVETCAEVATTC